MDISSDNINNLVKCLQATLSPDLNERKQGLYNKKNISMLIYIISSIMYN